MEQISVHIRKPERDQDVEEMREFEYQCLGDEMYKHFGKGTGNKIYPLFSSFRYTHRMIRDTWNEYLKHHSGKPLEYFLKMLNNRQ